MTTDERSDERERKLPARVVAIRLAGTLLPTLLVIAGVAHWIGLPPVFIVAGLGLFTLNTTAFALVQATRSTWRADRFLTLRRSIALLGVIPGILVLVWIALIWIKLDPTTTFITMCAAILTTNVVYLVFFDE